MNDFTKFTVPKLKKLCRENNLKGYSNLRKNDLVVYLQKNLIVEGNDNDKIVLELNDKDNSNKIGKIDNKKLNVVDLFCGCGGTTQGLKKVFNVVCGIDIWDKAIESYKQNHNHMSLCKDLQNFSPQELDKLLGIDVDILWGSPPCQGFSMAGKRDKKYPRNSLFMEFYKYLNYYKPKAFMMENVMGLLSMKTENGDKVIDIIMQKLEKDYYCCINKLYASDFYVPQNRRRVIIVGIRKDLNKKPIEIQPPIQNINNRVPVSRILQNKKDVDLKYFLSQKAINGIKKKKERMKNKGNGFGAQYLQLDKPSYTIPARYWKDGYDALVKYSDDEIRRLTVLELKRIQSFPDNYYLAGSKKDQIIQIGNAVACDFAYHLGKYLFTLLK